MSQTEPMLHLSGEIVEMGDLDPEGLTRPGFRIQCAGGRVVTITGLTIAEVRGLQLFANVSLVVSSSLLLDREEGGQIADSVNLGDANDGD